MKNRLQAIREAKYHVTRDPQYKSAKAFAEAHDLAVSTYTDHEQGRRNLSLEVAWKYADIFGCSLDEIAGRTFPYDRYSDPRQTEINMDFQVLDEASKDMAAASLRGMAAACAGEEDAATGAEHSSRTA